MAFWLYRLNAALAKYDPLFIIPLLQASYIVLATVAPAWSKCYFGGARGRLPRLRKARLTGGGESELSASKAAVSPPLTQSYPYPYPYPYP